MEGARGAVLLLPVDKWRRGGQEGTELTTNDKDPSWRIEPSCVYD